MASFSGVLGEMNKQEEEGTAKAPGVLKSFLRGVSRSPADVLALSPTGQRVDPAFLPERMTLENLRGLPTQSQATEQALLQSSGIPEPTTFGERSAERLGRSVPFVAAGLPGAGALGGLKAVAGEVITDVVASMFEQGAQDLGAGPLGQAGAGLTAAMLVPGVAVQNVAEAAGKKAPRAARRAGRAAFIESLGEAAGKTGRDGIDPGALRAIAKRYGVPQAQVRKAASELKRRIARDPAGGDRFVDEAIDRLDEGIDLFPDKTVRPTSRQMLGEQGGQNISSMEDGLSRADLDVSASIDGRRQAVRADLEAQFESLLPEGSTGGAIEAFDAVLARAKQAERQAWDAVPFKEMPEVSTAGLKRAVKKLREGPIAGRRFVPDEVNVIDQYGDTIPVSELQALRSELLDTQRAGSLFNATPDARRTAPRVRVLLDAVDEQIKKLPPSGSTLYRKARGLTRENADLFNRKSSLVSGLSELTEGRKIVSRIRTAKDPTGEAKRAIRILSQEPGGVENIRRVFIDELFDQELSAATPRRMLTTIKRNRGVYREVLGEEMLGEIETLLKKVKIARTGSAGTAAATARTGSNVSPVEMLFAGADVFTSPVQATARGLGAVSKRIAKDASSSVERNAILREALLDPELFKTLLEMPDPRAIPAWVQNWDKLVARSRARTQAAARVGTRTSSNNRTQGQP